jgi:hypothetical protein
MLPFNTSGGVPLRQPGGDESPTPEDILIEITVANRGREAATPHVLPMLWFRNAWWWGEGGEKPHNA